ncbi:puratrophin-1-like isoform X2 [Bacillus rossius redtenbacheri]|uniref:puratrophin-1-like isoform X2 n=1 Tax=Bacillus rossius redtenbacheri TaxID=93214 RepID=UPI002FDD384A
MLQRHPEKAGDAGEEAGAQSAGGSRCSTPGAGFTGLRELARSLKQHLLGLGERLEDTRGQLEDSSRCFHLVDKAYEWAVETMKFLSRARMKDVCLAESSRQLKQYLLEHPPITDEHLAEMWQLAYRLDDEKLLDQAKTAHSRCQDAMGMIHALEACAERSGPDLGPRRVSAPLQPARRRPHARGDDCPCLGDIRESAENLLESASAPVPVPLWGAPPPAVTWPSPVPRPCRECACFSDDAADCAASGGDGCSKIPGDQARRDSVPPVKVNSHLHYEPSVLTDDADPDSKCFRNQRILLIMKELIQTEKDYVESLHYITENYIPELRREDIPQALRGQRNVIFGNVENIFEFHSQYFLQELEMCENNPLKLGECFLRHEKRFYLYALYSKNKPKSDQLMEEYGTSFFKHKQRELGDAMDLSSYLLKPVQRMGKYALLLRQLTKACGEGGEDRAGLRSAEEMVCFQLRHGNDLLALDSLRDCDVNVKEQGRLLRQSDFLVSQGKGKKCLRHVFLFEELILFSKARNFPDKKNMDVYIYKSSTKTADIGLTAEIAGSPTKFEIWFRKRKPNDTFTLQSVSEETKRAWTEEISKILWKQALKNREIRLAEMSSMGIGNKPCLDIRPSADQINDRSISLSHLSKTTPRLPHAASSDASHAARRPCSLISVGSSSSSASHSSGTGSGYATLCFDSPRLDHRSATLNSQSSVESGIVADISLGLEDAEGGGSLWRGKRNGSVTSASSDSCFSPVDEHKGFQSAASGTDLDLSPEVESVKL